jgi:hypothetical protein
MAGKKDAKQKAGQCDRAERAKKKDSGEPEKGLQRDPKEQGEPKKPSMTKRRQVRKVATMVKRLKKNPEDLEQQPRTEAGVGPASEGGWDAQQQATVAAYAHSRGMQPREVLQALVNSMEKTLRKEKGENLAGQTSSANASQREEAAGKSEVKPNPGRRGRDLRERKAENNCVACSKDKRRGVPPKTRWKEEQKEKALGRDGQGREAQGKENQAVAMPSPEEAAAVPAPGGSESRCVLGEVKKGVGGSKGENTQMLVVCVSGVPREPANAGTVVRVTPTGSGSGGPQGIMHEINQQYLKSKYKFKEGATLKEYLRQRAPSLGDTCTLWEVLTRLKEIIRDNLLFDESNPAMIVGDAPLEAALGKKKVHVNEIQGVVQRQLIIVEASQGPLSARMLAGGMVPERAAPSNPRPETQAATTQASVPSGRVLSLTEILAGSVVAYRPAPSSNSRIIGTVSYTPPQQRSGATAPPQPATGQNGGRAPAATTPATPNFTGVQVRQLNREPGAARGSRLSREAAASISQIIVTLTLLLASAGPTNGFLAYSCDNLRSTVAGYALAPREECWMEQLAYATPKPRDGRIVSMRDGVRFPAVHCKMTETIMQADCDSWGKVKPWRVVALEKLVPVGPRNCMEVSTSRKVTLFNRTVALSEDGTAMETLDERVNCGPKGQCPSGGGSGAAGRAYARLTMRRIVVWKREATESLIKKAITKGANDVIPNYIAGGMDAAEGAYVWNYTMRNCPKRSWKSSTHGSWESSMAKWRY